MKKIFNFSLLGILFVNVMSPISVSAAESQPEPQVAKSSIQSEISPLATPYKTEVTLDNGESFKISRKFGYVVYDGQSARTSFRVISNDYEMKHMKISVLGSDDPWYNQESFSYDSGFQLPQITMALPRELGVPQLHDVNFELTNYSPGKVTFDIEIDFFIINLS